MVTKKEIVDQLKKINFKHDGWGRSEVSELPNIILDDEEIYECVNGIYDGGFALLVATNVRVLLIDKKPLNYLTVEDMRFDMISEMDYNNRMFGAAINISSGGKNLRFRSYNQAKLRKLIGHVQHCMAESKRKQDFHQEGQIQHLEQINKQLQAYLVAQQQYQSQLTSNKQAAEPKASTTQAVPKPPKPSHQLADYLFAQSLLARHQIEARSSENSQEPEQTNDDKYIKKISNDASNDSPTFTTTMQKDQDDIYQDGLREVFANATYEPDTKFYNPVDISEKVIKPLSIVINPIQVAISKLPMALRYRKFGLKFDSASKRSPLSSVSTSKVN